MKIPPRMVCHSLTLFSAAVLMLIAFITAIPDLHGAEPEPFDLAVKNPPAKMQVNSSTPLTFSPASGVWDLSKYDSVYVKVQNTGTNSITMWAQAANDGAKGTQDNVRNAIILEPGKADTVRVRLTRRPTDPTYEPFKQFLMYYKDINVRDNTVDPSTIAHVVVWLDQSEGNQNVLIKSVTAEGAGDPGTVPFFPFVDKYGQYMHTDWPDKIYTDEDFATRMKKDEEDMAAHWGPTDWDKWGGWTNGFKQAKTGFFYTKKVDGKWWLVDPDGALFWSYGPTGVGPGGEPTPVSSRENWFAELPDPGSDMAKYWGEGSKAGAMFYQFANYRTFNFGDANAERKYGKNWHTDAADFMLRRLRRWGFNTLGAWSDSTAMMHRKTPYTVAINYQSPQIDRFPDVFDPKWETALKESMEQERDTTANDPWNIGYFVDNELPWGNLPNASQVIQRMMDTARDSASMKAFVKDLQAKYHDIAALNAAWNIEYTSWDILYPLPDSRNRTFRGDAEAFGAKMADKYFSTVRKVVKSVAPKNLYLGVRFNGHIDPSIIQIAAKYADVISYNIYDDPAARLKPYHDKVDKPFLVSEFGVHSDLGQTPWRGSDYSQDPSQRGHFLEQWFHQAIAEPSLVGAHFFQFRDQPLTGRADGEATQRGLVNVADTPHFDLIQTNRRLSYDLYELRAK